MAQMALGRIGHMPPTTTPMPRSGFLRLLIGHPQAFGAPQAMDALVVDPASRPSRASTAARLQPQRGRLRGRSPATRPAGRVRRRKAQGRRRRWVDRDWPTTRQARRSVTPNCWLERPPRLAGGCPGSEVSLGQLLEHVDVELPDRRRSSSDGVLLLELLEPLGIVSLHPAVLVPPAVPGLTR